MTGPGTPENLESDVVSLIRKIYLAERVEQPLHPGPEGHKAWMLPEDLVLLNAGNGPRGMLAVLARELGRSAESCRQRRAFLKRHGLSTEQMIREFHRTR